MAESEKLQGLLDTLTSTEAGHELADNKILDVLREIEVLGRQPGSGEILTKKYNIQILVKYAFDGSAQTRSSNQTSFEAITCLANLMLLHESTRQVVVDLRCCAKAADLLKTDDRDAEFLASRILFFSTYVDGLDVDDLLRNHGLATSIAMNLDRHAKLTTTPSTQITSMARDESLKLLTNLALRFPTIAQSFSSCINPIATMLRHTHGVLQPPMTLIVNALMSLDLEADKIEDASLRENLFPLDDPSALTSKTISLADETTRSGENPNLPALLALITNLYSAAPAEVRSAMSSALLPDKDDRSNPLGTDATLASRLLRLTKSTTPAVTEAVGTLFFTLSNKSPDEFVANIGYGFAAGYLATHQLGSAGIGTAPAGINPVTGQSFDAEEQEVGRGMSDEEKEREAERLFVLFERLRATGVVDIKNPVQQAFDEGRLG